MAVHHQSQNADRRVFLPAVGLEGLARTTGVSSQRDLDLQGKRRSLGAVPTEQTLIRPLGQALVSLLTKNPRCPVRRFENPVEGAVTKGEVLRGVSNTSCYVIQPLQKNRPLSRGRLNGLALCAGVGGLELGLKLALGPEYQCVGYVERDS